MSVNVHVVGAKGNPVEVTPNGEQVVTTLAFAVPEYQLIDVINTPFNFYGPKSAQRLRIAGILCKGDRSIGANGAIITIYEAAAADSLDELAILYKTEVDKGQFAPAVPPFQAREGFFINAKTDDNSIHLTIYANFVPTPDEIEGLPS